MDEIILTVSRCEDTGWLVAAWDSPDDSGGITTQGCDLAELEANVHEAVAVHFDDEATPARVRLHFAEDPILVKA